MEKLEFTIKDFGLIKKAKLNIGKINIIAGVNGSGKSTASKIFYSFLASISNEGIKFHEEKISSSYQDIKNIIKFKADDSLKELTTRVETIVKNSSNNDILESDEFKNVFKELIENEYIKKSKNSLKMIEELKNYLKAKNDIKKMKSLIFKDILTNEFNNELGFIKKSFLSLENGKGKFSADFPFENSNIIYEKMNFPLNDVFYIETPFIFDFYSSQNFTLKSENNNPFLYHQNSLITKLSVTNHYDNSQNINLNSEALKIIDEIMEGKIVFDDKKRIFTYKKSGSEYNIKNTATGVKTIGILQSLLYNGLDTNSFIIMDEPEVHLHPSWQIKLAEVIVLLSKEEDINFYINSHSPQFIEAIEVFTEKYELEDKTNYYLTQLSQESNKYDFIEIEREKIHLLYQNIGNMYDTLSEIRTENLVKDLKE
ncbi:MAG: ATP-binding protein [Methanobrevibacter sp.]|jgi:predicted ATPase|nr:ATP-binding protein [Candidatus Methanovirga meridionalis]